MLRKLSLTSRLTLFFTVVAAAVVLGLGGLFMIAADHHFMELDRTALDDKRHLIEDILQNAPSSEDARARLQEALSHHHGLRVAVRTADGSTLFQSTDLAPPPPSGLRDHAVQSLDIGTTRLHVLHFQAQPQYAPDTPVQITVAIDTAHHRDFLSELQRKLGLYALLTTLLSGLLSWLAAHHGMAPLRAMKARAAEVTGQRLEERMPVHTVPIEMAALAQELNQMLDRLQQDFRRLSDFSSDLAHELRTPISNLLTQTQVTLSAPRDATAYREVLASNAEELQRLARMVSDMLLLAKTERGVDLPSKEPFSAALEAQALLDFYEVVAEEKHIHLQLIGDGVIHGDRLMFRRALSNLLSNALRHANEGGNVDIRIAESPQTTQVTVENTGAAIAPEALPRLFDRFYRADPARSHPASDGAGLGLPITRAIVQAHGGWVSAESGNGINRFHLVFPKSGGMVPAHNHR